MNILKVKLCVVDFTMMDELVSHGAIKCILVVAYIVMTFNDVNFSHCCNCVAKAIGQDMVLRESNFEQRDNFQW